MFGKQAAGTSPSQPPPPHSDVNADSPVDGDADYDPYKARVVEAPVSNIGTLLHFLKGSVGTGILAMPTAFLYAGLILGTFATFVTGALCSYGLNLLINTEYQLCKRRRVPHMAYADAMEYALTIGPPKMRILAKASGILVNSFLISYQLGICCVYIIFVAKNVKNVIDDYHCDSISMLALMSIFLVLFLAINYVPNLKLFAPLSGVANLLMLFGLCVVLYNVFTGFPSTLANHSFTGEPSKWIMFVGICLFAIESVGVVVSAEFSMARPQDFGGFTGILNIALMIVTFLYWFLGFFGYARYKDTVRATVTLNMPRGSVLSEVTQIFFSTAIFVSYGLQCYPAIEIIWYEYLRPRLGSPSRRRELAYQYMLRTLLVLFTFTLAMAFSDYLSNVIGFIGVACLSMLGLAFPGLMHLCLLHDVQDGFGRHKWILYKDACMFLLGCLLLIGGIYVNVKDILDAAPPTPECPVNFNNTIL